VVIPAYFRAVLDQACSFDSADLVVYPHTGDYWLHLVVTLPAPQVSASAAAQVVGVDVGISRIAVSSDNRFFAGKRVKERARRVFRLRRALQAKGTRSAKRHLRSCASEKTVSGPTSTIASVGAWWRRFPLAV
jgi:putative transposase